MARIIEPSTKGRRIIKLSTDDILSVVQDYQRIVSKQTKYTDIRNLLEHNVLYLPEEL